MSVASIYEELKTWQQGIGALLGLIALLIAAARNFKLNRRRDAELRREERTRSRQLYGEMRLLRDRVAAAGRAAEADEAYFAG